ncbi:type IV secretion system DNA-binding domain-containing protein [Patescibacteria group bacterium]|nr:type IV secretion system DNA-binding domain-containing protein [Patescibacteria group bacterium]MBU1705636.1 type IV secretion system DNA-binding domain-containing protein [Patescibacteria group bacterium]
MPVDPNQITYFARTNFRNKLTKFGIKADDRRRHTYVIGKTGMGKTVLMENMIISDIYAGQGCCYVDPHGDTAEKLIDYIPSNRLNDVVYFNPADVDFPIGFNILEAVDERHKHLVASGMMGVFKKIWENMWSSRMEYILNNTILALLDNPGSTLLGINRMLSDADFRKRMIGNVKDPIVRQFWLQEFASYNEKYAQEAVAPIQNKIGQFLSVSMVRNLVSQVKSTINIRKIMDEKKIFIINLSKGRIGEDNMRLLGGLLITKMQLAAMERVDVPEEEREDFYLYVDEFQNFAVESFAGILSEARKYRLCLTMAHQYVAQLSEEVRDAVFGNVGTTIAFRVGAPDAEFMENEFAPQFQIEDIINLPKYNVYLKLLIDGVTSQPFSALTLPPIAISTQSMEKVIKVSRERYSVPRAEIEEKIMKWSGMGDADVEKLMEAAAEKKKSAKQSRKPKFEYECTRCNKHMELPVELDKSRPIYCEDCIEIVREERKAGQDRQAIRKPAPLPVPPKVEEGEVIENVSEEPSISLSVIAPKENKKESKPAAQASEKVPARQVPKPNLKPRPKGVEPTQSQPAAAPQPEAKTTPTPKSETISQPPEKIKAEKAPEPNKPTIGPGQTIRLGSLDQKPVERPRQPNPGKNHRDRHPRQNRPGPKVDQPKIATKQPDQPKPQSGKLRSGQSAKFD